MLDAGDDVAKIAAAYWAGYRGAAAFVGSSAWNVVDEAMTQCDERSIPLLIALSEQVQSEQELAWLLSEPLDDLLGLAPHRAPQLVVQAAEHSPALGRALRALDVTGLPDKAEALLRRAGYGNPNE